MNWQLLIVKSHLILIIGITEGMPNDEGTYVT